MKSSDKNTYSAEGLQKAATCIPTFRNKKTVFLCPHCGAVQKMGFSSFHPATLNPLPLKSDRICKLPGAVLQKCPKCGGICFHPEYREPALTGYPSVVEPSESLPLICAAFILCLWSACYYIYVKTEFPNTMTSSDILHVIMFIAGALAVSAGVFYFSSLYGNRRRTELSAERLKNPEYLKAMIKCGLILPVSYYMYMNRDESRNTPETDNEPDVYPLLGGTCGYCGQIIKKSWEIPQAGQTVFRCPHCRQKVFDPKTFELAFHKKDERQNIYSDIRNECRKILLKRILILACCAIGTVAAYAFFTLGLHILFDSRHSVNRDSMYTLFLGGLFSICLPGGIFTMIMKIRTVIKMSPASFTECLNESGKRMKRQEYAESYAQGRSFFFDSPEDEQSDESSSEK